MVIDTSAIIAILFDEPERNVFARRILASPVRLVSAMSKLEASMVAIGRGGRDNLARLDQILRDLDLSFVPFDEHQANLARDAFARYGRGRHKAALNFGDCASYALAIAEAEPLLFKGTDFGATDVEVVLFE